MCNLIACLHYSTSVPIAHIFMVCNLVRDAILSRSLCIIPNGTMILYRYEYTQSV